MSHRLQNILLQNILAVLVVGAVVVLLTASILYLLLGRLGDDAGAAWAGRIAVVAAGVTLVTLATAWLAEPDAVRTPAGDGDRMP